MEDQKLPVVKDLVGDNTINVLKDTGCEGIVVGRRLVEDGQLTGKCCLIVRIDNTVLLAEGEMTHGRRDCPRLKREGSKVSSPKQTGSAAVRVVETRDAARKGSAGVTDTGCDVRAEVQDGLLQLASGKQVPAMVDCGACNGKKSVEDLKLPVVKDLVGDKTINVLRDTGCEGIVVGRRLVEDGQLTGKCCLIVRIDNTVLLAEGEMTHGRRDCPRLKREGSKVSSPKQTGSAAVRVVETRDAARKGSAGVTDTGCDVRAEVQDGLLQLASGKQVPAMVDCGACNGKKSVEDLKLPVVKDLVGDKTINVLRDTGCEGIVVGRRLVEDGQLTGKCCLIVRIDNTVLLAEGEMTHGRRDCPRLKREGSKVSSPKQTGSAAVRVVETRDAARKGSAGVTDTGCDVRAEVQDGLLQLASGKQVPAMVDC